MNDALVEGAVCQPNISPEGRRARRRIGQAGVVVGILAAVVVVACREPAWVRALVAAVPMGTGIASLLQARRHTCLMHAAKGTFEHADRRTTTKMSDADVRASRRVAFGIVRDATLIAVAFGALVALLP